MNFKNVNVKHQPDDSFIKKPKRIIKLRSREGDITKYGLRKLAEMHVTSRSTLTDDFAIDCNSFS